MAYTPEMKSIGDLMETRRTQLRYRQQDVAEALDITLPRYQQWESGENMMGVVFLPKVAEVLLCHPADLLGDPEYVKLRWEQEDAFRVLMGNITPAQWQAELERVRQEVDRVAPRSRPSQEQQ